MEQQNLLCPNEALLATLALLAAHLVVNLSLCVHVELTVLVALL